uniref:Septin-type G domain-containing protein n=1 Tax=Chinchilla lanigera TaxID=34839 RepID=A0A8C2VBZ0_CHILA
MSKQQPAQFINPETPGYVEFANLPNQVHRKSVKKGFKFTLIVVGELGLGKSTLINSLFLSNLCLERIIPGATEKIERTVQIETSTMECGVKLHLMVVDTPDYEDAINCKDCFTIISYISEQFELYLHDESGLNRCHIIDSRVHCCFYFISPSGHGLKPLYVAFMKAVHKKVNMVSVIAKMKMKILESKLRSSRPASHSLSEVISTRGVLWSWRTLNNDFLKLRTMLITHVQDLQEVTQDLHYENFHSERLKRGGRKVENEDMNKDQILLEKEAELRCMMLVQGGDGDSGALGHHV